MRVTGIRFPIFIQPRVNLTRDYFFSVPMTASGAYLGMTCGASLSNDYTLPAWMTAYLRVMKHVELFCRVPAGVEQDSLFTSRVVWKETGDIQHLTVHNHPAVILLVVLRNFVLREGTTTCFGRRALSLGRCG